MRTHKLLIEDIDKGIEKAHVYLIYHRDNPKPMNRSKSEDPVLPSSLSGSAVRENCENALTKKIVPTYELTPFSGPAVDQLNGILPDFNNRLSPERNLGLSPAGQPRLSPETHPRLVSDSCVRLSSSQFPETLSQKLEVPLGKGFEIKPDLAGRSLTEVEACSFICADLPITPLGSKSTTLSPVEEKLKSVEKEIK